MATTYYVATNGTYGGAGDKAGPWNLARGLTSVGGTPAPGDTVRIRAGTYSYADGPYVLGVSGTSDSARITYLANWDGEAEGDVILDGALGAVTGSTTSKSTGWALANGTGILSYAAGQYVSGAPAGTSGSAAPYVYQRDVGSAYVRGVFVNDYVPGTTASTLAVPGTANYWWVSLWNMARENPSYVVNPWLRIHDYDAAHDLDVGGLHKHDWRSQFRQDGTTLYARYDSTSLNTHSTFIGVGTVGVSASARAYITIDGGANDRFKFYRWYEPFKFSGCHHITLRGCEARWSGGSVVTCEGGCNTILVDSCVLYGGQTGHHDSTVVWFSDCTACTVRDSDLAFGGHDAVQIKTSSNCVVQRNHIHHTPHGVFVLYGSPGCLIEDNDIHDCGFTYCTSAHRVPHNGMHLGEISNSVIRRNSIVRCGNGINKRGGGWQNCLIYNNTIHDCQDAAIFVEDTDSTQQGATRDNVIQNNIAINSRTKWAIANHLFGNATNAGWNNKWRNNCCYTPLKGSGQISICSYQDDLAEYNGITVAAADGSAKSWIGSNWDNNRDGDPLLTDPSGPSDYSTGRDISETASSTLTINLGSETGLLGRPGDLPAVSTIDIGAWEYGSGGSSNVAPIAVIVVDSEDPTREAPYTIDVSGSTSSDSDGSIVAYDWDWGDGSAHGSGATPAAHTYTVAGAYTITLTVTDDDGATDTDTLAFAVIPAGSTSERIAYSEALVTASSYRGEQLPAQVADRSTYSGHLDSGTPDPLGYWVSGSGVRFPHTVKVDLTGEPQRFQLIDTVRISPFRWNLGRTYAARIYTSQDPLPLNDPGWSPFGAQFVTLASSSGEAAYEWTPVTASPVACRFVMVKLLSNNDVAYPNEGGLWELEVLGRAPDAGSPGAPYTAVAATDTDALAPAQFGPERAIDGELPSGTGSRFSRWASSLLDEVGAPRSVSLTVDLGSAKVVGRVRLWPYRPASRQYVYALEGSANGSSWANLLPGGATTHVSGSGAFSEETFSPRAIRYVRLGVSSCSQDGVSIPIASVHEVDCFAS